MARALIDDEVVRHSSLAHNTSECRFALFNLKVLGVGPSDYELRACVSVIILLMYSLDKWNLASMKIIVKYHTVVDRDTHTNRILRHLTHASPRCTGTGRE